MARPRTRPDRRPREDSQRGGRRSGRYTPPTQKRVRERPRWHQLIGWPLLFAGLIIAALNGLMYMENELRLLPGGFSLLYVLAGLPVAAAGAWYLGLFDEGHTVYR